MGRLFLARDIEMARTALRVEQPDLVVKFLTVLGAPLK